MTNITEPRYVLAVQDLEHSINYYQSTLGFTIVDRYPGWAFLCKDSFFVMLGECKETPAAKETGDHSYFAYLVVNDVNSLYNELQSKGAEFTKTLKDEDWGMREFGVRTIDGHRMMFGESLRDERT